MINARRIDKVVRSRSTARSTASKKLYVIKSFNYSGTYIYTKGTIRRTEEEDCLYIINPVEVGYLSSRQVTARGSA